MNIQMSSCVILAAFLLDMLLGDPVFFPHPIRWMGSAISRIEPAFRRLPLHLTISGALFAISLIAGTWLIFWMLMRFAQAAHPAIQTGLEIILLYFCLSASSLASASKEVFLTLYTQGLPRARKQVSCIVGRETAKLSESGVLRAAVETTAENLVDGVISPLFFMRLAVYHLLQRTRWSTRWIPWLAIKTMRISALERHRPESTT